MEKEIVEIKFKNLNLEQMLFVHAVIVPKVESVITEYLGDLRQLEKENEK